MKFQKCLKQTHFIICNSLYFNIFGQKSNPGKVLALDLLLAVFYPGLGPKVLNVGKHLKQSQLSNSCVNKCAQKSTPGVVLDILIFLLAVYGCGLGLDGPGELEEP